MQHDTKDTDNKLALYDTNQFYSGNIEPRSFLMSCTQAQYIYWKILEENCYGLFSLGHLIIGHHLVFSLGHLIGEYCRFWCGTLFFDGRILLIYSLWLMTSGHFIFCYSRTTHMVICACAGRCYIFSFLVQDFLS